MEVLSIVFFLAAMYGFGSSISFFLKEAEDFLERHLMRLGVGLGIMLVFGFLLNLLRIPLDWRIFLGLSILIIIVKLYLDYKKNELSHIKFNFNLYSILMLLLFAITLYMYVSGAFSYQYLEDDDSWSHAMGVKYVSMEKTAFTNERNVFHYLDPYPPAYDMLLGIIHQTNDSVYWTLKFFNAFIISLSIIFFFYFAKAFAGSSKKALFAAFALFAVPAYESHFIWAISLTMTLFFVAFYCVEKIKDDKKWWIVSSLVIMPTITSSPTHSMYFGLFFAIYFIARLINERRLLIYEAFAGLGGVALSFILFWIPSIMIHSFDAVLQTLIPRRQVGGAFAIGGTGDRAYTISDFLCGPDTGCYQGSNAINNPIGIGIILSILTIIGLIYLLFRFKDMIKKENYYILVSLLWFIFALYAVNAAKMPIKLSPFRAWMLLAFTVALLAGEAINFINNIFRSLARKLLNSGNAAMAVSLVVLLIIGFGVYKTSFIPKYKVNTANWPPGGFWASGEELGGYIWFKQNIPDGSKVFTFSNNGVIIGLDKYICHWCPEVREFQKNGINKSADEIYSWLKQNNYQYFVVDGQTVRKFGENATTQMLRDITSKYSLQPVFNNGIVVFRV